MHSLHASFPVGQMNCMSIESRSFEIEGRPFVEELASALLLALLERHDDNEATHPRAA
jgi:hypothetical protein